MKSGTSHHVLYCKPAFTLLISVLLVALSYQAIAVEDISNDMVEVSTGIGDGEKRFYALIAGCMGSQNESSSVTDDDPSIERIHLFIYEALVASTNWHEEDIILLTEDEASKVNILDALQRIANMADEDDTFLFCWQGHGDQIPDEDHDEALYDSNDLYDEVILPYDCYLDQGEIINCISDDELGQYLDEFTVETMIVNIEACFSGGMVDKKDQQVIDVDAPGRIVLMSTPPDNLGWIHPIVAYGWMSSLGWALSSPLSDRDADGWISAEEAFSLASPLYTIRTYFWYHFFPFLNTYMMVQSGLGLMDLLCERFIPVGIQITLSMMVAFAVTYYIEHQSDIQLGISAANQATCCDGCPGQALLIELP